MSVLYIICDTCIITFLYTKQNSVVIIKGNPVKRRLFVVDVSGRWRSGSTVGFPGLCFMCGSPIKCSCTVLIQVNSLDTEEGVDEVIFMGGGKTASSSYNLARLSGVNTPSSMIRSPNNFMIIRFVSDEATQRSGFNLTWAAGEDGGGHELDLVRVDYLP